MKQLVINFTNYMNYEKDQQIVPLPEQITKFSMSYDGGRLVLKVNQEIVYSNSCAQNDFEIEAQIIVQTDIKE